MTVIRQPLNSSALSSASYDDEAQTLTVTFKTGRSYEFTSVPPQIFADLVDASSPGAYFTQNIKDKY